MAPIVEFTLDWLIANGWAECAELPDGRLVYRLTEKGKKMRKQ